MGILGFAVHASIAAKAKHDGEESGGDDSLRSS
jgi:hypothetical protein